MRFFFFKVSLQMLSSHYEMGIFPDAVGMHYSSGVRVFLMTGQKDHKACFILDTRA